jgi:pyruvate formate lyase activating enzyme
MPSCDRRAFLTASALWLAGTASAHAFWPLKSKAADNDTQGRVFKGQGPDRPWQWSREAHDYQKLSGQRVVCRICPNRCLLAPGDRSACRSKANIGGKLYSLAYGNPCAVNVDPVEKKPLYHFLPGSRVFSLAVAGCNFRCLNCQNWQISQFAPEQVQHSSLFPDEAVAAAQQSSSQSIAYTYSEPITFYEYMLAISRRARPRGIKNLLISNGYINTQPLKELCRFLDGANINLKAFSDAIYRKLNGGRLEPVLETFKTLHLEKVHFEMTNLVVPGYTDDAEMVKKMCGWILENLGPDYPLHFLRFFPKYKLDRLAPTPVSTLARFRELAGAEGIHHVYLGNVPGHEGNHTYCPQCRKLIIERQGYQLSQYHLKGDRCAFCDARIAGVWAPLQTPQP